MPQVDPSVQSTALPAGEGFLDTLAAAYAETGKFSEALQTQREAIKIMIDGNPQADVSAFRQREALYESGKPYHEP